MSCTHRAILVAQKAARDIEREASRLGILRSVEATEASRWLKDLAAEIRRAVSSSTEISRQQMGLSNHGKEGA